MKANGTSENYQNQNLKAPIQNKVSLEDLQQHIDKIKINLDQAEKLIG
jgi:hypothetical protein